MDVLITGAGGFVGAAVVKEALDAGHAVTALLRPNGARERLPLGNSALRIVEADLRDAAGVRQAFSLTRPEVVVHSGWNGVSNRSRDDRAQISDNISAACALIEAGREAGIRKFVGIGSQAEYGPVAGRVTEQHLPKPVSLYGASKLAALFLTEQLAAKSGVAFAWMRLFSCYGPGDNGHWLIPIIIEALLAGQIPKTTAGEQRWDYLFIDDVARAILAVAAKEQATGIFNLGSGNPVPIRHVVETIRNLVDPDAFVDFGALPYASDQIWHMEADNDRLVALADWSPRVALEDGLRETVEWHRSEWQKSAKDRTPV
jgi:nucleoside-diphosphate-sugar epimerase